MQFQVLQKVSEYDTEISKSTRTLYTSPRQREEEPQRTNSHKTSGRKLIQSNQLSLPRQYDCKTRID